jgi:hypothetical protein
MFDEEAMAEVSSFTSQGRPAKRHAWLCFLLAALFFYNPFVTAPSSGLGLNVRHSASNRANVGASELQQFTAAQPSAPEVRVEGLGCRLPSVSDFARRRLLPPDLEVRTPLTFFAGSVWFRPPPVS